MHELIESVLKTPVIRDKWRRRSKARVALLPSPTYPATKNTYSNMPLATSSHGSEQTTFDNEDSHL